MNQHEAGEFKKQSEEGGRDGIQEAASGPEGSLQHLGFAKVCGGGPVASLRDMGGRTKQEAAAERRRDGGDSATVVGTAAGVAAGRADGFRTHAAGDAGASQD